MKKVKWCFTYLVHLAFFLQFSFDLGGYHELVVSLDSFFMKNMRELKFVVEFLQEGGNDED